MSLLKRTITFTRSTPTKDALSGEVRASFVTVGTLSDVPASIQQELGSVVDDFARRGVRISHSIYTKTNVGALQVGDRGTDDAGVVYVVRVPDDMAGRGKVWCVYADRLP